jgi:hypothetical protein
MVFLVIVPSWEEYALWEERPSARRKRSVVRNNSPDSMELIVGAERK